MAEVPEQMLSGARQEAERVAQDKQRTSSLLDDALRKAEKQEGRLKRVWADLMALFRLARAWVSGAYSQTPWKTIVLVLAAIIYFVNPLDLIPDVLLAFGYLDDATVIAWVLRSIKRDMDQFLEWEKQNPPASAVGSANPAR